MQNTKETQVVAVPKSLVEQIKEVVSSRLGYMTIAEYVRQAVREKLVRDKRELKKYEEEIIKDEKVVST